MLFSSNIFAYVGKQAVDNRIYKRATYKIEKLPVFRTTLRSTL